MLALAPISSYSYSMDKADLILKWIRWKEDKLGRPYPRKELASLAEISESYLSQLINKRIKEPEIPTLEKISNALDISLSDFLLGPESFEEKQRLSPEYQPEDEKEDAVKTMDLRCKLIVRIASLPEKDIEYINGIVEALLYERYQSTSKENKTTGSG